MPAGTVDFSTMTSGPVAAPAMSRPARSTASRLASPETRGGVPTQMNTTSASDTADAISGVKVDRLSGQLLLQQVLRAGLVERQATVRESVHSRSPRRIPRPGAPPMRATGT